MAIRIEGIRGFAKFACRQLSSDLQYGEFSVIRGRLPLDQSEGKEAEFCVRSTLDSSNTDALVIEARPLDDSFVLEDERTQNSSCSMPVNRLQNWRQGNNRGICYQEVIEHDIHTSPDFKVLRVNSPRLDRAREEVINKIEREIGDALALLIRAVNQEYVGSREGIKTALRKFKIKVVEDIDGFPNGNIKLVKRFPVLHLNELLYKPLCRSRREAIERLNAEIFKLSLKHSNTLILLRSDNFFIYLSSSRASVYLRGSNLVPGNVANRQVKQIAPSNNDPEGPEWDFAVEACKLLFKSTENITSKRWLKEEVTVCNGKRIVAEVSNGVFYISLMQSNDVNCSSGIILERHVILTSIAKYFSGRLTNTDKRALQRQVYNAVKALASQMHKS